MLTKRGFMLAFGGEIQAQYGQGWAADTQTVMPVTGDWNGDGIDTVGVKRGNIFYLRNSNNSGIADVTIVFGDSADRPVVGDYNGDGTETVGVSR